MYMYRSILVIALILVMLALTAKSEGFAAQPDVGAFYAQTDLAGAARGAATMLHDGQKWLVWSSDIHQGWVIKVTADGLPNALYLRSPGRINNLPAALGGLPAHENYTALFNSGRPIRVAAVPLDRAQAEVARGMSHCLEIGGAPAMCNAEFAPL